MQATQPLTNRINVDHVVKNSVKDLHVKGFDYLCLKRTAMETVKLYFFDGNVSKMPEVLNPHDHRYDFETTVLAGASENIWYAKGYNGESGAKMYGPRAAMFNKFQFRTPLNGGHGFTHVGQQRLIEIERYKFRAGSYYSMEADELHTIRIVENETVLMLRQFEDVVPLDVPTYTYCLSETAPSLDGCYNKFTADQVIDRLRRFEERTGIQLETLKDTQ